MPGEPVEGGRPRPVAPRRGRRERAGTTTGRSTRPPPITPVSAAAPPADAASGSPTSPRSPTLTPIPQVTAPAPERLPDGEPGQRRERVAAMIGRRLRHRTGGHREEQDRRRPHRRHQPGVASPSPWISADQPDKPDPTDRAKTGERPTTSGRAGEERERSGSSEPLRLPGRPPFPHHRSAADFFSSSASSRSVSAPMPGWSERVLEVRVHHLFDAATEQFRFGGATDRAAFGEDFVFDEGDQQFFFGAADPAEDVVGALAIEVVVVGVFGERWVDGGEVEPEFSRVGGVDRAFPGEQKKRRGDPVGGVLLHPAPAVRSCGSTRGRTDGRG